MKISYLQIGFALMIGGVFIFSLVTIWPAPMPWVNWAGYIIGTLWFAVGAWQVIDELLASSALQDFDHWE